MSCERFDRDDYEVRVADYLRSTFGNEEGVAVYIEHVPAGLAGRPGNKEERFAMEITVGSTGGEYVEGNSGLDDAEVLERHPSEDGEEVYEMRRLPNGTLAHVYVTLKKQRPFVLVPFFTISLDGWSMEHDPEQALGPSFKEGLRLLVQSYREAFSAWWGEGSAQSGASYEAAERLEAGPQPQVTTPQQGGGR
jgi:hypothetical protein